MEISRQHVRFLLATSILSFRKIGIEKPEWRPKSLQEYGSRLDGKMEEGSLSLLAISLQDSEQLSSG